MGRRQRQRALQKPSVLEVRRGHLEFSDLSLHRLQPVEHKLVKVGVEVELLQVLVVFAESLLGEDDLLLGCSHMSLQLLDLLAVPGWSLHQLLKALAEGCCGLLYYFFCVVLLGCELLALGHQAFLGALGSEYFDEQSRATKVLSAEPFLVLLQELFDRVDSCSLGCAKLHIRYWNVYSE